MNKLLKCILLLSGLLFMVDVAHAAIGLGSATSVYGSTSGTAFATSIPAGDVIVVFVKATSSTAPTVSDNVNSGNYSELNSYADSTNSRWMYVFFKVESTSGTPTVSVSGPSGNIVIVDFTGFTGTVTADSTPNGGAGSTSASTYSVSPVTTGQTNELILGATSQLSNSPVNTERVDQDYLDRRWSTAGFLRSNLDLRHQYAVLGFAQYNHELRRRHHRPLRPQREAARSVFPRHVDSPRHDTAGRHDRTVQERRHGWC